MASNSKNIAELLNGDVTVTATDIADGSVTSAKLDSNIDISGQLRTTLGASAGGISMSGSTNVSLQMDADNNTGTNPYMLRTHADVFSIFNQAQSGYGTGGAFFRYTESGNTKLHGAVEVGESGISFDSGSNYLDDYEEGTWNPALQTGIPGSPAASVSSANCRYVKIGGFVQASAYFLAANDGTNIQIGGLPFTINKYSSFSLGHQNKTVSFERMDNGNSHVNFTLSGTNTSLQEWYFSIQYYTTS